MAHTSISQADQLRLFGDDDSTTSSESDGESPVEPIASAPAVVDALPSAVAPSRQVEHPDFMTALVGLVLEAAPPLHPWLETRPSLPRVIGCAGKLADVAGAPSWDAIQSTLKAAYETVQVLTVSTGAASERQSSIVDVVITAEAEACDAWRQVLVPGGVLVVVSAAGCAPELDSTKWVTESATHVQTSGALKSIFIVRSRAITCNTDAVEWALASDAALEAERARIEDITICLSVAERLQCRGSTETVHKIVDTMKIHGMILVPKLMPGNVVKDWGARVSVCVACPVWQGHVVVHPETLPLMILPTQQTGFGRL